LPLIPPPPEDELSSPASARDLPVVIVIIEEWIILPILMFIHEFITIQIHEVAFVKESQDKEFYKYFIFAV